MAFTYRDMGRAFHECILHISCNGWMDCRDTFHAVLSFCNKCNKAEYKANRLISVQLINYSGVRQLFFLQNGTRKN